MKLAACCTGSFGNFGQPPVKGWKAQGVCIAIETNIDQQSGHIQLESPEGWGGVALMNIVPHASTWLHSKYNSKGCLQSFMCIIASQIPN